MTLEKPGAGNLGSCRRKRCRRPVFEGGFCRDCAEDRREKAAARQARYRAKPEIAARERERSFSAEQLVLRNARAYVWMIVDRGSDGIAVGSCETCGRVRSKLLRMVPFWNDPTKPREVRWRCTDCWREHRKDRNVTAKGAGALRDEQAAYTAALATLTPEQRAWVKAQVGGRRGPVGYALLKDAIARVSAPKDPFFS